MQTPEQTEETARAGIATYVVEAVVALLVATLGVIVASGSRALGAGWTTDGPGAGYFPFYIGLILIVSGAGIFYQTVLSKKRNTELFVDYEQLRRVGVVLVPALVYVGAIQVLGLYVASAIYIALFMIYLGKFAPWKGIVASLSVSVVFFLMFEVWFKVPLAKGMLDPLAFLGY